MFDFAVHRLSLSRTARIGACAATWLALGTAPAWAVSHDLAVVPLFDGQRSEFLNTWGGAWGPGSTQSIRLLPDDAQSGRRVLCIELGQVPAAEYRYLQCFASGFGPTREYYQTRNLARYERLHLGLRNMTHAALRCAVQVKDYRDSKAQSATYRFELPATEATVSIDAPLALAGAHWTVEGRPDLSRVLTIDFLFEPCTAIRSGRVYLSDVWLVEPGGPVDIDTSPLPVLVERLARRQWDALWSARNRNHGMIPNNSYQATDAGLNTTATVLWMLPAAIRRGWVQQADADRYVELLLHTIDKLLDRAKYLPPRNVDWTTLKPSLLPEESSVDAAFLTLALYQYKCLSSTSPPLRNAIDRTQNRFDFAAFSCPDGWRMACRYPTPQGVEGFVRCVYDGYTNEGNLISLAAHLVSSHRVPIETHWNTSTKRARMQLAGLGAPGTPGRAPIVHQFKEFRAPFTQALWNLFVDVRQRGVDTYPDRDLAVNPWQNFVGYEQDVMNKLAAEGRPYLLQPDAGDDGTLACYRQFSLCEDFGQGDLFMPWSVAMALLADANRSEQSLRFLLQHRLYGPCGLTDSAKWTTGAAEPYAVTARNDFWNTGLATMALLQWLDGPARLSTLFAALPEVHDALDRVFPATRQEQAANLPRTSKP
ncbi:MAG: hypothetical protein ACLP9L_39210 [Thermoguttaceae bacterium]